jgi:hypothetical protein
MELSRLFPKPLSKIGQRYRGFREFLAEVLEGNRSLLGETESTEVAPPFEVSNRFEQLLSLRSFTYKRSTGEVFTYLAPYFEAGACLHQKNGVTKLTGLFLEGKTFINENDAPVIKLGLSGLSEGRVVKGRLRPVLRALGLEGAKKLIDADVFAFSPREGVVFLLICNRPMLWQFDALEAAYSYSTGEVLG